MKHSDETIKAVMALHWQKFTSREIAHTVGQQRGERITAKAVREITSTYTLRHHGEPATRAEMGLEKKSCCG